MQRRKFLGILGAVSTAAAAPSAVQAVIDAKDTTHTLTAHKTTIAEMYMDRIVDPPILMMGEQDTPEILSDERIVSPMVGENEAQVHRVALWYNASLPTEKASAERGVTMALEAYAKEFHLEMGPVEFADLPASHIDLVAPPTGMGWGVGTRCIVGHASMRLKKYHHLTETSNFTHELDKNDLEKLRAIHRKHYALSEPANVMEHGQLTDEECDAGINELGPLIAVANLERYKAVIH